MKLPAEIEEQPLARFGRLGGAGNGKDQRAQSEHAGDMPSPSFGEILKMQHRLPLLS